MPLSRPPSARWSLGTLGCRIWFLTLSQDSDPLYVGPCCFCLGWTPWKGGLGMACFCDLATPRGRLQQPGRCLYLSFPPGTGSPWGWLTILLLAHQPEDLVQGEWRQVRGALPFSLILRSVVGWNGMGSKGCMEPTNPLAQGSRVSRPGCWLQVI